VDWTDEIARLLGVDPLEDEQIDRLLHVARDVAHRTERRITPLAAFLMGVAVERRSTAAGASTAFADVLDEVETALPAADPE
jgi:hypothetical protein